MECAGQSGDIKSIMEVLMLAVTLGSEVTLTADGDSPAEEEEALDQIIGLIENRFNEKEQPWLTGKQLLTVLLAILFLTPSHP